MSVACLDLKYSVTYFHKKTKDERRDSTSVAFAIAQHIEQEEEVENAFSKRNTSNHCYVNYYVSCKILIDPPKKFVAIGCLNY